MAKPVDEEKISLQLHCFEGKTDFNPKMSKREEKERETVQACSSRVECEEEKVRGREEPKALQ